MYAITVYFSERNAQTVGATGTRHRAMRVDRNVVGLGFTSMITDVSSEMVSSVIPLYLTVVLRFTAFQFGVFDGVYQGVAMLLRIASGWTADAWRRHKEVAGAGYVVSTLCKLALLASGSAWQPAVGALLADRVGKGIRTAPRDALIALSSAPERRGEAFGVHRAMDTAGALIGPLVAFAALSLAPDRYDAIFLTSFCVAVIGCAVLAFFVENRAGRVEGRGATPVVSLASVLSQRDFRALVVVGALVSVVTASDAFVYLTFQRRSDLGAHWFPLLYVGTALAYLVCAIPAGRLADRLGRGRVFVVGHVMLIAVYSVLLLPEPGPAALAACLALLGAYYAATDGVLMALASGIVSSAQLASGLAILTTVTALGRVVAAVVYGSLWSWGGPELAAGAFGVGLAVALVVAAALLPATRKVLAA